MVFCSALWCVSLISTVMDVHGTIVLHIMSAQVVKCTDNQFVLSEVVLFVKI